VTPQELAFWLRANRRAAGLAPDIAAAILRAFAIIRDSLSDTELARLVDSGDIERLIRLVFSDQVMDRAFIPVRQRIRQGVDRSFRYAVADLPKAGRIDGTVAVMFDHLNPKVIDAVRALETKVVDSLKGDIKETVRAFVENGLRDGVNPGAIGRQIRSVVGVAPSQEAYVQNLRTELESGKYADAARRKLLDKRFNLGKLDTLKPGAKAARIDKIVEQYRKSYQAFNAETIARTASLDAMKQGQRLSWIDAIEKGIVDGDRLRKKWSGALDARERPEHLAMQDETVPFFATYSNGEDVPGDSTWNCRCLSVVCLSRETNTTGPKVAVVVAPIASARRIVDAESPHALIP
jgi:hypothetical protein